MSMNDTTIKMSHYLKEQALIDSAKSLNHFESQGNEKAQLFIQGSNFFKMSDLKLLSSITLKQITF